MIRRGLRIGSARAMVQDFGKDGAAMNNRLLIGSLTLFLSCLPLLAAAEVQLKSARWSEGRRARLLLDFTRTPVYRLSTPAASSRLIIDVTDATLTGKLVQPPASHPAAARIGSAPGRDKNSLRLWIALRGAYTARSHLENHGNTMRLVLEWAAAVSDDSTARPRTAALPRHPLKQEPNAGRMPAGRFVVAIDAGHGGKDTGAIGPGGAQEKDVVLAIARKLAGFIRAERGMSAVMVRDGDRFLSLRHRLEIARSAGADLLVSLHADAHASVSVKGASIYTPRKPGAREASELAATKILRELKRDFRVHHENVQRAGFMVLKCPDIPSLLVETAFISNPEEESRLKNPRQQERMARTLFKGIRAYAAARPPVLLANFGMAEASKN